MKWAGRRCNISVRSIARAPQTHAARAGEQASSGRDVARQSLFAVLTCATLLGCSTNPRDETALSNGNGPTPATTGNDSAAGGTSAATSDSTAATGDESTNAGTTTGSAADESAENDTGDAVVQFLRIEPGNVFLDLDLNTPHTQAFSVTALSANGAEADVTDEVVLSVTNDDIGVIVGNELQIPASKTAAVRHTEIHAELGGATGRTQLTFATYEQSGPEQDFFFILPFEDRGGEQAANLTFETGLQELDVFFNMDTTASMGLPLTNLQAALQGTLIPGIQAQIPDSQFGVGAFEDFPVIPFSSSEPCAATGEYDQPFELLLAVTDDTTAIQSGVDALTTPSGVPIGCGFDPSEAGVEALYQIATGAGLDGPGLTSVAQNMDGIGGAGFREGAMPVIITVTDESSHNGTVCPWNDYAAEGNGDVAAVAATEAEAMEALRNICARSIAVSLVYPSFDPEDPLQCNSWNDAVFWAEQTGAVVPPEAWDVVAGGRPEGCAAGECCTGENETGIAPNENGVCPIAYFTPFFSATISEGIVAGIEMLASYAAYSVFTQTNGETASQAGVALPNGVSTEDFIRSVVPVSHGAAPLPAAPPPQLVDDHFEGVTPNTDLVFEVRVFNDFVEPTDEPQIFRATISVLADGCAGLDEREVWVIVPPLDIPPPG